MSEKKPSKETIEEKVKRVNQFLKNKEPDSITVDHFSKMTGYKPQYILDAMNSVFGIGSWGFVEIENKLIDKDEKTGKPSLAIAQVEVWIREVESYPVAYGQSRVTRGDYGDAKKGAQTDAIKKALSYFSVGNRAYHGLLKCKESNGKSHKTTG